MAQAVSGGYFAGVAAPAQLGAYDYGRRRSAGRNSGRHAQLLLRAGCAGSDQTVIGKQIKISQYSFTIVGVTREISTAHYKSTTVPRSQS